MWTLVLVKIVFSYFISQHSRDIILKLAMACHYDHENLMQTYDHKQESTLNLNYNDQGKVPSTHYDEPLTKFNVKAFHTLRCGIKFISFASSRIYIY